MITITKDKIYQSNFSLKKTKADSEQVKEIEVRDIIFSMGDDVELGEDVTFQRIFDIIIFHKEFFNILFSAEMDGITIDDFISDYEQSFDLIIPNQSYKLRLSWSTDVYDIDNEIEYYDYPVFEAFGKIDTRIEGGDYPISIEFTSLSEIKDKLVFLEHSFEIENEKSYEDELEVAFKANYRPFSLSNLIGGILREITEHGKPEDRDKMRKELTRRNEEINSWIEDGSIYEKIVRNDDIEDELSGMIEEDLPEDDNLTFWDTLYPKEAPTGKSSREIVDEAIIAISEGSSLPLEKQLQDAVDADDYEKAAKIQKLIEKRDKNKK